MAEHVYPAEAVFDAHARSAARWTVHPLNESLKAKAVAAGLWNLWLPAPLAQRLTHLLPHVTTTGGDNAAQLRSVLLGAGLSHAEYAPLCEVMGRSVWAPEIFNCRHVPPAVSDTDAQDERGEGCLAAPCRYYCAAALQTVCLR